MSITVSTRVLRTEFSVHETADIPVFTSEAMDRSVWETSGDKMQMVKILCCSANGNVREFGGADLGDAWEFFQRVLLIGARLGKQ